MSDAVRTLTVVIPLRAKPRGGRKAMVTPGVLALERRRDVALIRAVAWAFRWWRMLESGQFVTVKDLAVAERINSYYVSRVLRLTLLAPDIVEAIMDGRQSEGMTLPELMKQVPAVRQDHRRLRPRERAHLSIEAALVREDLRDDSRIRSGLPHAYTETSRISREVFCAAPYIKSYSRK